MVSTAAGAVGSAVGQIAKLSGCRTVGIAGGPAKVAQCRELFGYDAAIDYKSDDLESALARACPKGVDLYFDNTGGAISDVVLRHLAVGARVVICGTASVSSWNPWPNGPRAERHLLVKRARMQGSSSSTTRPGSKRPSPVWRDGSAMDDCAIPKTY